MNISYLHLGRRFGSSDNYAGVHRALEKWAPSSSRRGIVGVGGWFFP